MGCATSKREDVYEPATPVGSPIAKPAEGTEAGRQSAAASTASNEQEAEELAAHQERNYGLRKPASESDRMRTLNTLAVLDSEPEERFDDITKLCKLIFNVRAWEGGVAGMALVTHLRESSSPALCGASMQMGHWEVHTCPCLTRWPNMLTWMLVER